MALPATDSFTAAVNAALTTYSASWTLNNGNFYVNATVDRVFTNAVTTETGAHWNADAFDNDQYGQLKLITLTAATYHGAAARAAASAATWYGYYVGSSDSYLYKIVTGSWAQIGSTGGAFAANDVVRLEASGVSTDTTLTPKKNGSTTGTPGVQTGRNDGIGAGSAGLCGYGVGAENSTDADDWEGGNLGGGGLTLTAQQVSANIQLSWA